METTVFGLEELHLIQIEMLRKFISVCGDRNLTYFLAFGSLLGATRDHKVIPWDDSIDVVMPYKDYESLTNLPQEIWGGDLFMQTYRTDPEYPKNYAKLRNSNTTLVKSEYADLDINQGIYINIIPLISLAKDPRDRRKQIRDAKLFKAVTENKPVPAADRFLHACSSFLLGVVTDQQRKRLRDKLRIETLKYENEYADQCFALSGYTSLSLALPVSWFASGEECDFEGILVAVPQGWREWLSLRYGDYRVMPISELQGDKTASFVTLNTGKPYTEYKGKTYCLNSK